MGQPPVGPTCHGHKGRCLKAPKRSPVGVVACVGRARSTQPPTPPPSPQKKNDDKISSALQLPIWRIEISGGPNSSPAKSLFSTVPFRAQIAQIPNSPPTLESPLVSSLSPPFPNSVPDDDDEDDGRTSPPYRSYLIYALVHRTRWSTNNVGRHNRRASQTPSSTASGALHRRRLPAHRSYFTEHIVAPPPPEAVGASPTVSSTAS